MYGNTHAKIIGGNRYYFDNFNIGDAFDIKEYGIEYFLSSHSDFLNDQEIEILTKYFENNDQDELVILPQDNLFKED
jgi:hypothetical protein